MAPPENKLIEIINTIEVEDYTKTNMYYFIHRSLPFFSNMIQKSIHKKYHRVTDSREKFFKYIIAIRPYVDLAISVYVSCMCIKHKFTP